MQPVNHFGHQTHVLLPTGNRYIAYFHGSGQQACGIALQRLNAVLCPIVEPINYAIFLGRLEYSRRLKTRHHDQYEPTGNNIQLQGAATYALATEIVVSQIIVEKLKVFLSIRFLDYILKFAFPEFSYFAHKQIFTKEQLQQQSILAAGIGAIGVP